jgi:hypothetical protein
MICLFDCKLDQHTDEPFSQKIEMTQFTEVDIDDNSVLFKLAAKQAIENNNQNVDREQIESMSVKYQVLSKHTKMIGVKKNRVKASAPVENIRVYTRSNQVMSQHENFNQR